MPRPEGRATARPRRQARAVRRATRGRADGWRRAFPPPERPRHLQAQVQTRAPGPIHAPSLDRRPVVLDAAERDENRGLRPLRTTHEQRDVAGAPARTALRSLSGKPVSRSSTGASASSRSTSCSSARRTRSSPGRVDVNAATRATTPLAARSSARSCSQELAAPNAPASAGSEARISSRAGRRTSGSATVRRVASRSGIGRRDNDRTGRQFILRRETTRRPESVQPGILSQDRRVQLLKLPTRLDAQLFDEPFAGRPVTSRAPPPAGPSGRGHA